MGNFSSYFKGPAFIILAFFVGLFLYTRFAGPLPFSVTSVTTTKEDVFSVTGEGAATAIPNIAKIGLGLTLDAPTVGQAQKEVNTKINKLISDLKNLGVTEKDIKTQNYSVNPKYDFTGGVQRVTGYTVTTNLEVRVLDLEKINNVIDTATANGANLVGSLIFDFDDQKKKELTQEARVEAVSEAKEKAESLSKAANVRLGKIINISESPTTEPPIITPLVREAQTVETQVQPGTGEIKVNVTLSYQIL